MKGTFALGLLATATEAYKLTTWSKSKSESVADGRIALGFSTETEWYWGIRSPVQWAKFEDYHEAISWSEEAYTKFAWYTSASATLSKSNGESLFGLTVAPWIMFWDIAFLENLWYLWPELGDEEKSITEWDHCNYMGWWYKTARIYLDIGVITRECSIGVHAYIDQNANFDCYPASYSLSKVKYWKIKPFDRNKNGMYEWGINHCQDYDKFDQRDLIEKSFLDSIKGDAKEMQETDLDDVNTDEQEDSAVADDFGYYY
jgi:hypothetical protein